MIKLHKCDKCDFVFEVPDIVYEEGSSVPAPFGEGYVTEGSGYVFCCPECKSTNLADFDEDDINNLIEEIKLLKGRLKNENK